MKKTKTIFAGLLALLLAGAMAVGLAACGGSVATDDVEALSTAVSNTRSYSASYTTSANLKETVTEDGEKITLRDKVNYSYDSLQSIVYASEDYSYSDSEDSEKYFTETYTLYSSRSNGGYTCYDITDGEKSMYTTSSSRISLSSMISYFDILGISRLTGLSNYVDLNNAVLYYATSVGFSGTSDEANVKIKFSGSKYTMSAKFDEGELSISITVKNDMITKLSEYVKIKQDDDKMEFNIDMDISYSFKSSLASNFSDLESFETEEAE